MHNPPPNLHIILYQPEIAPNTGNAIRLCANIGAHLHLVGPLGFVMEDRRLRRAGLDYHELARVTCHADLAACLAALIGARLFAFTAHAERPHTGITYQPGDALLFGPETRGLPTDVIGDIADERRLRIPMRPGNRSINLSNAVAVGAYEAWRQMGFPGGC